MCWMRSLSIAFVYVVVLWNHLSGSPVAAQPSGGAVVDGQAVISAVPTGIDVHQQSQNAVINWQSFSLGAAHTANFHLPNSSAAVLNRVTTAGLPSEIFGTINSNGNVYLINPAGVVIGPTGVINAHGFTASALDIPNAEFMRGGNLHFRGGGDGTILNQGTIVTGAGGVALIGGNVINQGTIISEGGSISLIVGKDATLTAAGKYIQADTATLMNGVSEYVGVINNDGVIRATGAAQVGGEVYLVNPNGTVLQAGIIAAQQQTEAEGLVGGEVQVQADAVVNTGKIDASGTSGGRIDVAAATVIQQGELKANAAVDTAADAGGGAAGNGGEINIRYMNNYLDTLRSTLQAQGGNGGLIRVAGEAGTQAFVSGTFDASAFSNFSIRHPPTVSSVTSTTCINRSENQSILKRARRDSHSNRPVCATQSSGTRSRRGPMV